MATEPEQPDWRTAEPDGDMVVVEIDKVNKQARVTFTIRGQPAECWFPIGELEKVLKH